MASRETPSVTAAISRRQVLKYGVLGGSLLVAPGFLAACASAARSSGPAASGSVAPGAAGSSSPQSLTGKLVVVSYGGDYQTAQDNAYWKPFQAANPGVTIVQDSPSDNAKIKAMVESGSVTWDIALVDDSFGLDTDAKWLEPIDYAVIDKSAFLPGYAQTYRLGADVEATVLAYRSDKLGSTPQGFVDFFDATTFPGKRAVWNYVAGGILEAALIADGVAADQLYPVDVDRALKKLESIRKDAIWWDTGAQSQQLLTSGEATFGLVWTGRAVAAAEAGVPVKIQWNQWLTQNGWWVIPKGAPNKGLAMQLLKFQTAPAAQDALTKYLPYGPTNQGALAGIDPKYKDQLPTSHLTSRVTVDSAWWAQNFDAADKKFKAWLLA